MKLSTGVPSLDTILGGGLLPGSLLVLAGPPGSGKTILAQQIAFANATPEKRAVYYTTLSEPHTKLIRHLSPFSFFDEQALGTAVEFNHLQSEEGASDGFRDAAAEVVRRSFEESASVIVIDSVRALHTPDEQPGLFRRRIYDLATLVSHTEAVLIFVGEYMPDEIGTQPEFAVADAIVYLTNESLGSFDRRMLHVLKLRGSRYIEGRHRFTVNDDGIVVFPRLESLPFPKAAHPTGRVSTGVQKLDEMMDNGVPAASATLVAGPSGVGKTCMSLGFVAEGLANKERCLYVSFQESDQQLLNKAHGFGWEFQKYVDSGQLEILFLHPVELSLDRSAARIREALDRMKPKRLVVDSISELEHAASGLNRYADYLWALVETFRQSGVTTLLTNETPAFFGPAFELAGGLSYVFDNVILLRYTELRSEIHRALAVVKMRESEHVKSLVEFDITNKGVVIKGDFAGMSGVLTGTPVPTEQKFKEFFGR
jgi:circadian clock protein KaiC